MSIHWSHVKFRLEFHIFLSAIWTNVEWHHRILFFLFYLHTSIGMHSFSIIHYRETIRGAQNERSGRNNMDWIAICRIDILWLNFPSWLFTISVTWTSNDFLFADFFSFSFQNFLCHQCLCIFVIKMSDKSESREWRKKETKCFSILTDGTKVDRAKSRIGKATSHDINLCIVQKPIKK